MFLIIYINQQGREKVNFQFFNSEVMSKNLIRRTPDMRSTRWMHCIWLYSVVVVFDNSSITNRDVYQSCVYSAFQYQY